MSDKEDQPIIGEEMITCLEEDKALNGLKVVVKSKSPRKGSSMYRVQFLDEKFEGQFTFVDKNCLMRYDAPESPGKRIKTNGSEIEPPSKKKIKTNGSKTNGSGLPQGVPLYVIVQSERFKTRGDVSTRYVGAFSDINEARTAAKQTWMKESMWSPPPQLDDSEHFVEHIVSLAREAHTHVLMGA